MKTVKLGLVPAHRGVPFDEEWAINMRQRTLKALGEISSVEVVVPAPELTGNGLVRDDADAAKVIDLFAEKEIDGIVIGTMTFGDELSAVSVAEAFPTLPLLLFGTKEGPFTPDGGRRSDAFCGTLAISSGLCRRKIPFVFTGICLPEEEIFIHDLEAFARTCAAVKNFYRARIGLIGPRPERFETCAINEYPMIEQFAQRVVPISLPDLFRAACAVANDDEDVAEIVKEIKADADCREVTKGALIKAAKLELALKHFADERDLSAMAIQCWNAMQEDYGICSCMTMGRLTQQGVMCSCETDVHGALTMLAQYHAALGETVPHFIDWTIQHQSEENIFLAWHCGNAPPVLAREDSVIRVRVQTMLRKSLGPQRVQGAFEFQLRPGVVTLNRLVEYDRQFKMLIVSGDIIPAATESHRGSWSWVKVSNLKNLYRVLVKEGFIHHASMIHGDYRKPLIDFCQFTGIEPVIV